MDKYYVGFDWYRKKLELFADDRPVETAIKTSGYDFVSAPFDTQAEAQAFLDGLEVY
jgi:hypothetical protein